MSEIKIIVFDVDGTLTDGKIYMSANGELMKAFNIKDGYAIARLNNYGIMPVIITGRKSAIVEQRCKELGINEIHQGVENKIEKLKEVCQKYNTSTDNCAYIGDDLNDLECMSICGFSGAPADAVDEVTKSVDYVCKHNGGEGAVREFCDKILNER